MAIKKNFSKDKKKCTVTFSLPAEAAPNATSVRVVGDFNNWNWNEGLELNRNKNAFQGKTVLEAGQRHEFRYLIDNQRWENDWQADEYAPSPYGCDNSVLVTPSATATKPGAKSTSTKTRAKKAPAQNGQTTTTRTVTSKGKSGIDFTVIEGVGPKICQILEKAGYNNFDALSKAKVTDLRQVLENAGSRYKMHDPSKWAKQARFAAKDQWSKLNEFQAELKKGK